jgi:plastocyanin
VRRRIAFLLGSGLALGAAAPAAAAEVQVRGLDSLVWDKPDITVAAGDTVTWTFEPNQPHNVSATSPNWAHRSTTGKPAAPSSFAFTAEGVYTYVCEIHSDTMKGTVTVGSPPPPPPPPLSEQPFPNDSAITVGALETGGLDTVQPAVRDVSVRKPRGTVRVSFRVSEQSVVSVRFLRRGRTVKTKKARVARRGAVSVGGLKPGRYAVRIRAVDVAGNESRVRRARVTLRSP